MNDSTVPTMHREVTTPTDLDRQVYDCPDWCNAHDTTIYVPDGTLESHVVHMRRFCDDSAPFVVDLVKYHYLDSDETPDPVSVMIREQERAALEYATSPAALFALADSIRRAAQALASAQAQE